MQNILLRAKQNFDCIPNSLSPEYANEFLKIEIRFPKEIYNIKEVFLKIYSSSYMLIGNWNFSYNTEKTFRKISADIASEHVWSSGLYRVYVFINGNPK